MSFQVGIWWSFIEYEGAEKSSNLTAELSLKEREGFERRGDLKGRDCQAKEVSPT